MAKSAATLDQIKQVGKERGIEFYFAQFVDLYGRPSAKLVPAANLDDLVAEGAGFAGFAAGDIGQVPSDPDIAAMPDLASFTPVPWQSNLARFACDITVEGEPWPYCPRTILAVFRRAGPGTSSRWGSSSRPSSAVTIGSSEIADAHTPAPAHMAGRRAATTS